MKFFAASCALFLCAATVKAADTIPISEQEIRHIDSSPSVRGLSKLNQVNNLIDDVLYTSWVGQAVKKGAWLRVQFVGTRYVTRLDILPGCAGNNRTYSQYSRPRVIEIHGRDRAVTIVLADKRAVQQFEVNPPLPAEELTIRVVSTYPGKFNAVCFSELRFHEQDIFDGVNEKTRQAIEAHAEALIGANAETHVRALVQLGAAAIPRLSLALEHGSTEVQRRSLRALKAIGSARAANALLRYYRKGPAPELLAVTLQAIARTGDSRAVAIIVSAFTSDDHKIAEVAANAMNGFGPNAIDALVPLLKHDDYQVVARALRALRHINSDRVVQLSAPFVTSRRPSHRIAAATALSGKTSSAALALIETLAKDDVITVRLSVVNSLGRFSGNNGIALLETLLNDTDDEVASGALAALAKRDQGIQVIGRYLLNSIAPLGTEAVKALSESGHADALTVMIEALRRGESRFRTDLRNGIANFGPTGVRALLSAAMSDEWLQSDCEVVLASNPGVATPLITELIDRDPSATPSFLIRALGAGNGAQAITALDKAFDSGSLKVQFEVIRAWGRFPAGIVGDRLTKVMLGNDHVLRSQAVVAIGKARVKQAAPLLMELLKDDSFPAELTIDALGALEASEAGDLLVERFILAPLGIRFAILRACKRIQTPKCMNLLYDAAGDLNANIRNEALKLLALR